MLSGISKHLLFGAYPALLLLVILAGHQSCSAIKNCAPSSCGNIHNISYPFRLSTDPNSCGNQNYELTCENNRPALYLKNKTVKYYVQAIDYSYFTIHVVDADVQEDDCFSIPRHSVIDDTFDERDNYYLSDDNYYFLFMSCPNPILSPPDYIVDASSCKNGSSLFNSTSNISSPSSHNMEATYSYVFIAYSYSYYLRDIPDLCHVNLMYPSPFIFYLLKNRTNISYIDVRDIILYGFDLQWSPILNDIEDLRSVGPITIAIDFLTNRILSQLGKIFSYLSKFFEHKT
nr:uncharacterized protein LOC118059605 [Populus alba]